MRELSLQEAAFVAGGNDTITAGIGDACAGQSGSTYVSYQSSTGLGPFTVKVNCGEFGELQDSGS